MKVGRFLFVEWKEVLAFDKLEFFLKDFFEASISQDFLSQLNNQMKMKEI
jgi:hypothetical protein